MSKLKVAKAVLATFKTIKWLGIAAIFGGVVFLLWLWAVSHFLSFAIVIGIVVGVLLLCGLTAVWDWSRNTIETAEKEERHAQERHRIEKLREENPDMYVPSFDADELDSFNDNWSHR